ncbi:MAG: hypothetical protein CBB71_12155 [Rhodopirellula sp. TMED11]|nr:MAG: hypothetical protein CBB71_12155 [Rhodopirellula sp. TMED11]
MRFPLAFNGQTACRNVVMWLGLFTFAAQATAQEPAEKSLSGTDVQGKEKPAAGTEQARRKLALLREKEIREDRQREEETALKRRFEEVEAAIAKLAKRFEELEAIKREAPEEGKEQRALAREFEELATVKAHLVEEQKKLQVYLARLELQRRQRVDSLGVDNKIQRVRSEEQEEREEIESQERREQQERREIEMREREERREIEAREMHERDEHREIEAREIEAREMHEREMHEREMHEREMHDREMHDRPERFHREQQMHAESRELELEHQRLDLKRKAMELKLIELELMRKKLELKLLEKEVSNQFQSDSRKAGMALLDRLLLYKKQQPDQAIEILKRTLDQTKDPLLRIEIGQRLGYTLLTADKGDEAASIMLQLLRDHK